MVDWIWYSSSRNDYGTYYLAFERMYRKRYNNFVKKLNDGQIDEKEIYNMNPKNTDLKYEVFAVMLEAVKSFSVIGFYILFICITNFIKIYIGGKII